MPPILLYDAKGGKVEWFEKEQIVVKTFYGYIQGEEFRAAFNAGYEQFRKKRCRKWLSDNRGVPVYKPEDVEWINTDWFPRMVKAGWKYWALVEPESMVGRLTMDKFGFFTDKGIDLQIFGTLEQALSWLVGVDHTIRKPVRPEYQGIDLGSPALLCKG